MERKVEINDIIKSFMIGNHPSGIIVSDDVKNDYSKNDELISNPIVFVDEYSPDIWFTPQEYQDIDVETFLFDKCKDEVSKLRTSQELELYKEKELYPLLQFMIYLVEYMRENGFVWGAGRGSSVSSYILYLIGVHKIDSLKYNLSIDEFLK